MYVEKCNISNICYKKENLFFTFSAPYFEQFDFFQILAP